LTGWPATCIPELVRESLDVLEEAACALAQYFDKDLVLSLMKLGF
jgi:hypothetical protein